MPRRIVDDPIAPDGVVRTLYRAFEIRDLSLLGSLLAEPVVWVHSGDATVPARTSDPKLSEPGMRPTPPNLPAAAVVGRNDVLSHFESLVESSGGLPTWRLRCLYAHAIGRVVAVHEVVGSETDVSSECLLFEIGEGRVERLISLVPARCAP